MRTNSSGKSRIFLLLYQREVIISWSKANMHVIPYLEEADMKRIPLFQGHSIRLLQPEVPVECQPPIRVRHREFPDESVKATW